MEYFVNLVKAARQGDLNFDVLAEYCLKTNTEIQAGSNAVAKYFAESFLASISESEFDDCDQAMGSLLAIMASEPFFELTDRAIPEFAFGVYQAFDAGEYLRLNDRPDEIPYVKYTVPMLREVLGGLHAV
jgi:hypothetical protein